jgi:hypothetical protein
MPPKKATTAAKPAPAKAPLSSKRKASNASQDEPEAKKTKTAAPKAAPKKPAAVSDCLGEQSHRLIVLSDQGHKSS